MIALAVGTVLEHPCPECGGDMILRSSKFGLFYGCSKFPSCRATHGAHKDGRPLGVPADRYTKDLRIAAHDVFDRLWQSQRMTRSEAYEWMRRALSLSPDEAHVGRFDASQCQALIAAVRRSFPDIDGG